MNLENLFDNIEIKNDNRVCEEDLKELKKLQEEFDIDKEFHFKIKNLIENEFKGKVALFGKGDYTKRKLMEANYNSFMSSAKYFKSDIYNYFNRKYNCELKGDYKFIETCKYDAYDENRIIKSNEKLKYCEELDYNKILDEIFEQLGGLTFENKQEDEIITYLKDKTKQYREDSKKVIIKGKKVTINDFFGIDSFDARWGTTRISYSYHEEFNKLFQSFDIFGQADLSKELNKKVRELTGEKIITKHEFTEYKNINSLKFFKNGRIDIEFTSNLNAIEYTKKFLSYEG